MKKYFSAFLMLLLLASFVTIQENDFTKLMKEKLNNYVSINYPEKVYIHTDKPYYSVGEDIWFSAYLLDGVTHTTSTKSNTLYVELINQKDSIVAKKRLFMSGENTAGDFQIPKKTALGKYTIRAYTNYMRNENPDYFFKKEISILSFDEEQITNKTDTIATIEKSTKSFRPDLNFYPEGGHLVTNLNNAVAVKLKDAFFEDIPIDISIFDNDDNFLLKSTTTKFGLGLFYLQPTEGKSYYAILNKEGVDYKYNLPKILKKGYTLNALDNGKNLLINTQSNDNQGLLGTSLVIHQRGNLLYNVNQTESKVNQTLKIPIDKLENGVVHITLFNPENKPVCERIVYINNPNNRATISIQKPKDYYGRRKKVTLNLNVKDINKVNIATNLSMSVRDLNGYPENTKSENIKTWLLLNSDLRGKIKNPGYFFEKENDRQRKYLLDLVMRTNGWRRFTWQNLLFEDEKKQEFEIEKGITISGKTLDMKSPYGIKSVPTRFTFFGKQIAQEPIQISNKKGEFSYGPYIFFDSIPVLLEARLTNFASKKDRDRKVLIVQDKDKKSPPIFRDTISKNKSESTNIASYLNYKKYLKELDSAFKQQEYVLNEVVIKSRIKDKEDIRKEEMNAKTSYGGAFRRFDAQDGTAFGNTAFELLENLQGVFIDVDSVYVRNFGRNTIPLILLDEAPIDAASLQSINADNISFMDLLTNTEAALFSNGGAVISIYSTSGNGANLRNNVKRKPGIIDFKAVGFYTAREFYAPDHINGIEEQTKGDIRTTLHWTPKLKTSKTGDITVEFFTSDSKSNYLIEVEGITETGIPVYGTSKIIVE